MEVLATFDDFSKGHYGDDPRRPVGWYGGYSGHHLPDGGWKVRNGTVALSSTGFSNNTGIKVAPVDAGVFATTGTNTWFVADSGAAPVARTALAASGLGNPTDFCAYSSSAGHGSLFTLFGDKTYKVTAGAVTALAGSPGGNQVATLGDRIYVGGISGALNRVQWSDAANEASWTASNFLDIGPNTGTTITLMKRQRDALIIALDTGIGTTTWWRLAGTPELNQTLTPIAPRGPEVGTSTLEGPFSAEAHGSRIWYGPTSLDNAWGWLGWIDADTPVVFNKVRPLSASQPTQNSVGAPYSVVAPASWPAALFFAGTVSGGAVLQRALLYVDGAWASMIFGGFNTAAGSNAFWLCAANGYYYLAQGGSTSLPPRILRWAVDVTHDSAPSPTTDNGGSTVSAELHLPLTYDASNSELRVQAIAVDFRHYTTGTTFTATVDVHGQRDAAVASTAGVTVPSLGSPGTAGEIRRATIYTGAEAGSGAGFQVKLTSCREVTIERVIALGEREPSRT